MISKRRIFFLCSPSLPMFSPSFSPTFSRAIALRPVRQGQLLFSPTPYKVLVFFPPSPHGETIRRGRESFRLVFVQGCPMFRVSGLDEKEGQDTSPISAHWAGLKKKSSPGTNGLGPSWPGALQARPCPERRPSLSILQVRFGDI